MTHFKPFFYTVDEALDGNWKRIFVEPGKYGMVTMEILCKDGTRVEFNLAPEVTMRLSDRLYDAADTMLQDDRDWQGEEV